MWKSVEDKLNRSGRKWKPSVDLSNRCAELFCEECGVSLGIHDIVYTNLESTKYCGKCVQKYIIKTPEALPCGVVREDNGGFVTLEYTGDYYKTITVYKTCYFNKKGRYIKVNGKRHYLGAIRRRGEHASNDVVGHSNMPAMRDF